MKKIEEYTRGWNAALKATAEFANRNLNQEVSQPEEIAVSGSYSTKDIHVSEEYLNTTNYQDYPKTSTTTSKVENNTEECKHKYILESHCMGLLRIRCLLCGDTRDIADSTPIQELLSERSFSKEELRSIQSGLQILIYEHNGGNIKTLQKVDRLLSLEK